MSEAFIGAVAGLVPGLVTALVTWLASKRTAENEKRKNDADADVSVAGAWRELHVSLKADMEQLREQVDVLNRRVFEQEQQLAVQRSQLEQQEQHEEKLREKLSEVFEWIEAGAVPPPPEYPDWLKRK